MKDKRRQQGHSALNLVEEATHLLRTAPAATLAVYYLGSMPFVLGLLFFWADMSRNPFASEHLADASLAMGLLFLWMKFWQTIFARRIRAQRGAQEAPGLTLRKAIRIFLAQTIWQPSGLFLIPLSLPFILPIPWVYGFYQNVTALADGEENPNQVFKKSWRHAGLWQWQNTIGLIILAAFGLYVFWNWAAVCLALPEVFKMLFGIESKFTTSPWSMLNSTFFAAMFGLAYLCVDPVLKTVYVLRCFYGESLQSGEDLKAELKDFVARVSKATALIVVVLGITLATSVSAVPSPASSGSGKESALSSAQLDNAINRTIHERKFIWRMPRTAVKETDADEGVLGQFFDKIGEMLKKWARALAHWLNNVMHWLNEWLRKLLGNNQRSYSNSSSGTGWVSSAQLLLWTLVAVVASALAIFLYRVWQGRQKARTPVVSHAIVPMPDIRDENVAADQLPEEEWTRLGRELLARGELRLAMRAFYLASLAHLAARNLISIARFKSNREYERELRRRGHSFPQVLSVFGNNILVFESVWYGTHAVNLDSVNQFAVNVEKLKGAG